MLKKIYYLRELLSFLQGEYKVRMPCAECISGRCLKMHQSEEEEVASKYSPAAQVNITFISGSARWQSKEAFDGYDPK